MKSKMTVSSLIASTSLLFIMLGTTGCEMLPPIAAGAPASTPSYAGSDAPQEKIPRVQSPYAGKTVAATAYLNKTLLECKHLGDAVVGVLPEYLLEAGFQPVEGSGSVELKSALDELKYGLSENVNSATAAKIGGQLGAKYVFVGEINGYRVAKPEGARGITFGNWGLDTRSGNMTYDIQVSGRLVDVETRAIVACKTVAHSQTFKTAAKGGLQTPWGTYSQEQTATVEHEIGGKVLKVAMNRLVSEMATQLNGRGQ